MDNGAGVEGRRIIAEGREAVIHEWDHGLVLRLMRSADSRSSVAHSTVASEAARNAGVPIPRVFDVIEVDNRPAQILERIDGPDLFAHLAKNPLRLPRVATQLATTHVALHQVQAPAELLSTHEHLAGRIEASELVPENTKSQALDVLAALPAGDAICHGDYHPGNVLLTDSGPMLIDWTGATRGDPVADFARTRLMLQVGEVPPGAPAVIRALARVGRGALWRLYVRSYRRAVSMDPELLEQWTFVVATNRLADGIDAERSALLEATRQVPS